jgi:hypothetical protein
MKQIKNIKNIKNIIIMLIIIIIILIVYMIIKPTKKLKEHLDPWNGGSIWMPPGIPDIHINGVGHTVNAITKPLIKMVDALEDAGVAVEQAVINIKTFSLNLSNLIETIFKSLENINDKTPKLITKFSKEDLEKIFTDKNNYTIKSTAEKHFDSTVQLYKVYKKTFSSLQLFLVMVSNRRIKYIFQSLSHFIDNFKLVIPFTKYYLKYPCYIEWHRTNPPLNEIFNKEEYRNELNSIWSSIMTIIFALLRFLPSIKLLIETFEPVLKFIATLPPGSDAVKQLQDIIKTLKTTIATFIELDIEQKYKDIVSMVPNSNNNILSTLYDFWTDFIISNTIPENWSYSKNKNDISNKK